MRIPRGIIIAWASAGAIPGGWQRLTALDGRHPRGAEDGADGGGAGGSASHGHGADPHNHGTGLSHTHAAGTSPAFPAVPVTRHAFYAGSPYSMRHDHPVPAAEATAADYSSVAQPWSLTVVEPPFFSVLWIVSDGSPLGFPDQSVTWWPTSSLPASWTQHSGSQERYLRGAAAGATHGGDTGGSHSHSHSIPAHTHSTGAHTHVMAASMSGAANNLDAPLIGDPEAGNPLVSLSSHLHTVNPKPSADASSAATSGAPGTTSMDPAFTYLVAVQNGAGAPDTPKGAIALFLGALADAPFGWLLCDGSAGTTDLRGQFVKAVTDPVDAGMTAPDTTVHGHSSPATHTHADPGHTHPLDGVDNAVVIATRFGQVGAAPMFPFDQGITVPQGHDHLMTTGPASTSAALAADAQDVLTVATDARPLFTDVLYLAAPGEMAVSMTSPLTGATLTQNNPTVSWTLPGGETQARYELTVYADDDATVVYSSGVVVTATQAATVPAGHLHNGQHYRFVVASLSTTRDSGISAEARVLAAFTPSATIAGLTATAEDDGTPPNVLLGWTLPVVTAGQSYVQTNVLRRLTGTLPWGRIAVVPLLTTLSFRDYTALPNVSYDYAVTLSTLYGGDLLESLPQDPAPAATLAFDGVWIHLVGAPSQYLLYHAATGGSQPMQDLRIVPVWGRQQPTAHVGQQQWQEWTFVGAPHLYPSWATADAVDAWAALGAFVAAARSGGAAGLCFVRFGKNREGGPGVINWSKSSRADAIDTVVPTLVIDEVFYDASTQGG